MYRGGEVRRGELTPEGVLTLGAWFCALRFTWVFQPEYACRRMSERRCRRLTPLAPATNVVCAQFRHGRPDRLSAPAPPSR